MANTAQQEVWIGAASPLLTYSYANGGNAGTAWKYDKDGIAQYSGKEGFVIDLQAFYSFYYTSPASFQLQVGLDGALEAGSAASGSANLSTSFGSHSAKLQCNCTDCEALNMGQFIFQGVKVQTQVVESGGATNITIDDASSEITYTGFQSTSNSKSDVSAIQSGTFYERTISYTSSGGASAAFSFQGSALYIFGMTGPGFGSYQISIDSKVIGTYNASTSTETYNTLLFLTTYLDSSNNHQVTITNQNDGLLFALDYAVAVSSGSQRQSSQTANRGQPSATAVFPSQGSSTTAQTGGGDSGGAVIGGILGTLAGLFLLWICWRYRQWKKAGGEGSFLAALCGGLRKKKGAKKEENKFHLWPMVWSRPKYDT